MQASDGTSEAHVTVTWSAVSGATSYDVYRDGTLAASGVAGTSWQDTAAEPGAAPAAPTGVTASTDRTDRVRVAWAAASAGREGRSHTYTVAARNDAGTGARSTPDAGYRAAPTVSGYEVSIDGGTWQSAGMATARSWDDTGAPAGTVTAGTASASDGTSSAHVTLSLTGAAATPGATRAYRVRAAASDGRDGAASAEVSGWRAVGAPTFQWERTSGDDVGGPWSNLPRANSASFDDDDAPSHGSGRYYRCAVSADGTTSATSEPDRGFRSLPDACEGRDDGAYPEICTGTSDCCNGLCLSNAALGYGICTQDCDDWWDCNPPAFVGEYYCSNAPGGVGLCAVSNWDRPCDAAADCPGEACLRSFTDSTCTWQCDSSSDCPDEAICATVGFSGGLDMNVCTTIGETCTVPNDCLSGTCVTDDVTGLGYCTAFCDVDPAGCPEGYACQFVEVGFPNICVRL